MFSRLPKNFQIAVSVLFVILVPFLFILALYLGNQDKDEPEPVPVDEEPADTVEAEGTAEDAAPSYTPPPTEVTDERVEVLPTETDKSNAQEVAAAFIEQFHIIDPDDPMAYFLGAEPYMTKQMKEKYQDIPRRGTLTAVENEIVEMEILPAELETSRQVWSVFVSSRDYDAQGMRTETFTGYSVLVVKDGPTWLVDGVRADEY